MNRRLIAAGALAAVGALAVPASSQAATLQINKACYTHFPPPFNTQFPVRTEPIVVAVTGGTPGARFQVAATVPGKGLGSAGSQSGTFDAAGNGTVQITDVFPPGGSIDAISGKAVQLTVQDFGLAGSGPVRGPNALITNLGLTVDTKPRSPRKGRNVRVSGTVFAGQTLYGFIVKPNSRKVLKKFKLGKADGCGYIRKKAIVAPRSYAKGNYRLYVNAGKTLDKEKAIYSSFRIFATF